MCLYPLLLKNPKYLDTKKNQARGYIPLADPRVKYVPTACGECEECRKAKSREWQVRLNEEIKVNKGIFVTLTFSQENLDKLYEITETDDPHEICKIAIRRFLERWRKKYKVSCKHWLINELGHSNEYIDRYGKTMKGTNRIHLHGILFTDQDKQTIENIWSYGYIWIGNYCNSKTINYIVKYVTKLDSKNPGFKPRIFTSPGIGSNYINTWNAKQNKFNNYETNESYKLPNGFRTKLPIYYRNKIYSETEREKLWLQKIENKERYILGVKYPYKTTSDKIQFLKALKYNQTQNIVKGYGTRSWKEEQYIKQLKNLNDETEKTS